VETYRECSGSMVVPIEIEIGFCARASRLHSSSSLDQR